MVHAPVFSTIVAVLMVMVLLMLVMPHTAVGVTRDPLPRWRPTASVGLVMIATVLVTRSVYSRVANA